MDRGYGSVVLSRLGALGRQGWFGVCALAALAFLGGCASRSGGFLTEAERPKLEFVDLQVANRIQRSKDPRDAVRVYLRVTNRSDVPVELLKSELTLSGSIEARQETSTAYIGQSIPAGDSRVVEIRMRLASTAGAFSDSISLLTTARGQMIFRHPAGDFTLQVNEALRQIDAGREEDED